jgi:prepilin signal peptidase PulO-like enzyme (type II secretory pathway)
VGAHDHVLPGLTGWDRTDALVVGLVGAAVGSGLINVTRFLGTLAFRREAMGSGDAYLMAAIGGCLGWEAAVLVYLGAPFLGLPYGIWQVLRARRAAAGPKGESQEEPAPPKVCLGTFLATVAGFALLGGAVALAGPEWGLGPRLMLLAGLLAFGASFIFLRGEEEQGMEGAPRAAGSRERPASDAREVPYGPFLGLAAGVMMLVQDFVVEYFRPGVEAMWHTVAG